MSIFEMQRLVSQLHEWTWPDAEHVVHRVKRHRALEPKKSREWITACGIIPDGAKLSDIVKNQPLSCLDCISREGNQGT